MTNWTAIATSGLAALAAIIGAVVGYLIERDRSRAARVRDDETRVAERERWRAEFQRSSLMELKDAVTRLGRSASQIHLHDMTAHRHRQDDGKWGSTQHDYELSEAHRQNVVDAHRAAECILESSVREAAMDVVLASCQAVSAAVDENEAVSRYTDLTGTLSAFHVKWGRR